MNLLRICRQPINIAESPAVRRWGVAGARRFWWGWGAFMYAFLVILSGYLLQALALVGDERTTRFFPYVTVALIILAASLLTRMLMRMLGELRALDSSGGRDGDTQNLR